MKRTDNLPRKSKAVRQDRKRKDVAGASRKAPVQSSLADLMKNALGVVDSGVPDLASNPEHLAGFGRDAYRRR